MCNHAGLSPMDAGDPNPGPRACIANMVLTEPSSQAQNLHFLILRVIDLPTEILFSYIFSPRAPGSFSQWPCFFRIFADFHALPYTSCSGSSKIQKHVGRMSGAHNLFSKSKANSGTFRPLPPKIQDFNGLTRLQGQHRLQYETLM